MDLIAELNSLGIDINTKYPNINKGGCAVYASIVGKALQDMGVKVKVLVAAAWWAGDDIDVDLARSNVKNKGRKDEWRKNGVSFGHVGLEFYWKRKKYHYDSNGCHRPDKVLDGSPIIKGRMLVEECIAVAAERAGWNGCFYRRHIPGVRKMVKKHFTQMQEEVVDG